MIYVDKPVKEFSDKFGVSLKEEDVPCPECKAPRGIRPFLMMGKEGKYAGFEYKCTCGKPYSTTHKFVPSDERSSRFWKMILS